MTEIKTIKDIPEEDFLTGGHSACKGCPGTLGLKLALRVLGKNTIVVNASGCLTLLALYPHTPLRVPWIHNAIENAGATATGIYRAYKRKKRDVNILCYDGDGATYDIGLQSLSGACERMDKFVYICYNNEAYGNTGMQKSSASPYGARTSTTPPGKENPIGKTSQKKDMEAIMAAHEGTYVATASLAFPVDYARKVQKAKEHDGPSFIDLQAPCPTGWAFDPSKTIEVARAAVMTGVWPLFEIENGKTTLNVKLGKLKPVEEYLNMQTRFKHLSKKETENIQESVNKKWEKLLKDSGE